MIEVEITPVGNLAGPVKLLEESARGGEPLSQKFVRLLQKEIEFGSIKILSAYTDNSVAGVVVLAFRPGISIGEHFASVEDLYVKPNARRQGIGSALLKAAENLCGSRNVSYIEVQAVDDSAREFYRSMGYGFESGVWVLSRSVPLGEARRAEG